MPTDVLKDGFKTLITFADFPTVEFEEVEVTPPGVSGGGENDTTNMRNTAWRTRQPKKLKTLSNASLTVNYDPRVLDVINSMINQNQLITVTFPNGDTWAFWGWLDEFTPGNLTEGEQPTADVTLIPSNENASGEEVAPAHELASGTS